MNNVNIDCVILWVDGNDTVWQETKRQYQKASSKIATIEDASSERYRDWGILKYLFRGLEQFAPWFRKIFFVTCGHRPDWLNEKHPKLTMVNHEDFIPSQYLPTFNSHTIELNLHRIKGISEQFVYFNDDMFLLNRLKPDQFFKNNLPCDSAVFNAIAMEKSSKDFRFLMPINNIEIINAHFNKKKSLRQNFRNYFNIRYGKDLLRTVCLLPWVHFTGFVNYHLPYSLLKSTFQEIWDKEELILDTTCSHRFRNQNDVNIWLLLYWHYASGRFNPRTTKAGNVLAVSDDDTENDYVYDYIRKQKRPMVCINDNVADGNYEKIRQQLISAFEAILPEKSSFEL
ncbi:MAG: capsule biosynthesis protein CapG [Lachnospiraceae bacterium]|nr:capsule biosynthesis protein CapG [Lachnospiraceae bacterium]